MKNQRQMIFTQSIVGNDNYLDAPGLSQLINLLQQRGDRGPVRRIFAAMSIESITVTIEQKISARLKNIGRAITLLLHSLPHQPPIEL